MNTDTPDQSPQQLQQFHVPSALLQFVFWLQLRLCRFVTGGENVECQYYSMEGEQSRITPPLPGLVHLTVMHNTITSIKSLSFYITTFSARLTNWAVQYRLRHTTRTSSSHYNDRASDIFFRLQQCTLHLGWSYLSHVIKAATQCDENNFAFLAFMTSAQAP